MPFHAPRWCLAALLCLTASGCGNKPAPAPEAFSREFSGQKAFEHVELELSRKYIEEQLRAVGWTERQTFTDPTPHGPIEFTNLIARPADARPEDARAVVCTHYDTKYFAPPLRFVGANDGGSGTGALIEFARVLGRDKAFARRFELVFFDGEEAIVNFVVDSAPYDGLYGSRHYAHALSEGGRARQFKMGVLWDMMGDRDLDITMPSDSPPKLAAGIFAAADALGTRSHFGYFKNGEILDDHHYLNRVGIPTLDLIDFDFAAWHTPGDTLDKVSAESLQTVGQATLYFFCGADEQLR